MVVAPRHWLHKPIESLWGSIFTKCLLRWSLWGGVGPHLHINITLQLKEASFYIRGEWIEKRIYNQNMRGRHGTQVVFLKITIIWLQPHHRKTIATTTHHPSQNIYHIYIIEFNIYKNYILRVIKNFPTQSYWTGVPLIFWVLSYAAAVWKINQISKSVWTIQPLDELFICLESMLHTPSSQISCYADVYQSTLATWTSTWS